MSLADALSQRRSVRNFLFERISDQQLSDLLWSACGISSERKSGDEVKYLHTNPTACNHQEVRVYVFMHEGVFLYDSTKNCLMQIKKKDCRENLSKQKFIQKSAISLCLVSDVSKMIRFDDSFRRELYSPMDVGYVSENIYLYCAANNIATCACGQIYRDKIAKILGLNNARVMLVHPIGKGN
jgi:SagB-type dehydrogenase family enzyme